MVGQYHSQAHLIQKGPGIVVEQNNSHELEIVEVESLVVSSSPILGMTLCSAAGVLRMEAMPGKGRGGGGGGGGGGVVLTWPWIIPTWMEAAGEQVQSGARNVEVPTEKICIKHLSRQPAMPIASEIIVEVTTADAAWSMKKGPFLLEMFAFPPLVLFLRLCILIKLFHRHCAVPSVVKILTALTL